MVMRYSIKVMIIQLVIWLPTHLSCKDPTQGPPSSLPWILLQAVITLTMMDGHVPSNMSDIKTSLPL